MRQRPSVVESVGAGGVPAGILLGPCIELWQDDDDQRPVWCELAEWPRRRVNSAWRNWRTAKSAYLDSIGLPWPRRADTIPAEIAGIPVAPWSFEFCAERYPEYVATRLAEAGLPPDWRPPVSTPARGSPVHRPALGARRVRVRGHQWPSNGRKRRVTVQTPRNPPINTQKENPS